MNLAKLVLYPSITIFGLSVCEGVPYSSASVAAAVISGIFLANINRKHKAVQNQAALSVMCDPKGPSTHEEINQVIRRAVMTEAVQLSLTTKRLWITSTFGKQPQNLKMQEVLRTIMAMQKIVVPAFALRAEASQMVENIRNKVSADPLSKEYAAACQVFTQYLAKGETTKDVLDLLIDPTTGSALNFVYQWAITQPEIIVKINFWGNLELYSGTHRRVSNVGLYPPCSFPLRT